jgi:DNA-binding IclR family transcriptional regulator
MAEFGKALRAGLDIVEALHDADGPVTFGNLRERIDVSAASFTRFLGMLCDRGYVRRSDAGYVLGGRLAELGRAALEASSLRRPAEPFLRELRGATEEAAELAEFQDGQFVFLERLESPRAVVLRARPGSRFPIHASNAIGRLAIACGCAGADGGVLDARTAERIRREGFDEMLQNNDECWRGAAVVRGPGGDCAGALVIAAPAFRVGDPERARYRELLTDAARRLSEQLRLPPHRRHT